MNLITIQLVQYCWISEGLEDAEDRSSIISLEKDPDEDFVILYELFHLLRILDIPIG